MKKFDSVDLFALVLFTIGAGLFAWGYMLDPPASHQQFVLRHFGDWTPGFAVDGILLFVLNRVIHANERKRIMGQVASLSNEFSLDAVRRCREEKWLQNGIMENMNLAKARLFTADLSDAMLSGVDLSFADLTGADLTNANLRGANLNGANLTDADLRWADLTDANLQWADLRNAQLDGAILSGIVCDFASIDAHNAEVPEFQNAVIDGFLSARQIGLVKSSFELLLVKGSPAIVRFYERLFDTAPEFQKLFSTDVERQARKFLQSIKLIVGSLSSMERAAPVLNRLGSRHQGYGVEPGDYDVVGGVLIETLQEALGDNFTDEVKVAWVAAFGLISTAMLSANTT